MSTDFEHVNQNFRQIFENSPAIMLLIDPASHRIIAANKAAEDFYGWKRSALESMSINDINSLSTEEIEAEMDNARQSNRNYFRLEHRLANGKIRNVEVYSGKVEIDGKEYLHHIVHDVTENRQTEYALKENEEKFKALLNQVPEALFLHKLDGTIVDYNHITLEKYGYTAGEILQLKTTDIDPDYKEREDLGTFWKELTQKKQLRFEARHMKKDGTIFPAEVSLAPIEMKGEKYYLALAADITERKQAEELIRHNQERLREAEKIGKMGHVDWIVAEQRSYWSDEVFEIYERDPKLGVPAYEEIMNLHQPEDAARLEKAVIDALQKGKDYDLDLVALMPSGKKKYLHVIGKPVKDANGDVTNIKGIVQDITERKLTEEELRIKDKSIESSHNAIALVDLDNKLTYVNPAFLQMWGYEKQEEVLGKSSVSFWISENEAQKVSDSSLSQGSWKGELTAKSKDGSTFIALVSANLVTDDQGKPLHKMASFIDITERKQVEEALRESEERFRSYIDHAPDGVFITDENGRYVEVNQAACKITGYIKKELLQKHIPDLLQKSEIEKGIQHFKEVQQNGSARSEIGFVTKSGENRFWHVAATKLSDTR
ncbi:MAG: PAS domain S-box protein, partial [Bacteroidales bacterium]|nr:PAS domain S-box protein [Bacteroidales bacterium]